MIHQSREKKGIRHPVLRLIGLFFTVGTLFFQSGCEYAPVSILLDDIVPDYSEYDFAGSVTDQPYAFVNSRVVKENEHTEYIFVPPLGETDPLRIFYGAGTCTDLRGEQIVALFFIDDDESTWDAASIDAYTEKIVRPALAFLEKEAEVWEIPLQFDVWRFSSALSEGLTLQYDGIVNPDLFDGGSTKDLFQSVAKTLGYSREMALRWAFLQKSEGANIIPMFVLNKDGTSYARQSYIVAQTDHVEYAVLFWDSEDIRNRHCSTFAHELLHLFGAEDLYQPDERYALTTELYPWDVMCLETRNMDRLSVGEHTAYTLGWTEVVPSVCEEEAWYENNTYYEDYRSR